MNPVENSLPQISAARTHAPRVASSGRTHSSTRETLLRLIEAQAGAITIARLAAASGCHENTVRGHVHALWRDGFLERELAPAAGKGRPSWLWRAIAAAPPSPYAGLAIALAEGLAATGPDAPDRARAVGAEWGRSLAADLPQTATAAEARRTVIAVMREQGFGPREVTAPGLAPQDAGGAGSRACSIGRSANGEGDSSADRAGDSNTDRVGDRNTDPADDSDTNRVGDSNTDGASDGVDVLLRQCPLVAAAAHRPDIVCAVHLGMVTGALEAIGARDAGSTLLPMTGPGECTLTLRVRS